MSIASWVLGLSEDYIIQWANKGLLRRGYKQLEKQDISQWQLTEKSAQAEIAGFKQTLTGVGFEHLQCSCPAIDGCFHLTCFLLGLKQLAKDQVIEPEADNHSAKQSIELETPWLIVDDEQRRQLLGKANIMRALRWINQGITAEITEDKHNLKAIIYEKERYQIIIPRVGGLAASICNCKKNRCAHRALVVIQTAIKAGVVTQHQADNSLDQGQAEVLQQLKHWLNNLALQGMSGISKLQIECGQALATELQQSDLAKSARLQNRLVNMLEQEWQRQLISSPTRLRYVMAELQAYLNALSCQPLPQPLFKLAGEHQRIYRVAHNLTLIGITAEQWQTIGGYHGYTMHFYAPDESRYYSFSEVRNKENDKSWDIDNAFQKAIFSGQKLNRLLACRFLLKKGWFSQDGRLSTREGGQISDILDYEGEQWLQYSDNLATLTSRIAGAIKSNPYIADYAPWAIVRIRDISILTFDQYLQRWIGEGQDEKGQHFQITLPVAENNAQIARCWQRLKANAQAVFGRWSVEKHQLSLAPVALYCINEFKSLSLMVASK